MKILIVEDSHSSRVFLTRILHRIMEATVVLAETGKEAVEIYRRELPDLILLDVILPDIDGYEVAQQIRCQEKDGRWAPIIFLSGRNQDSDLERGITAGGDDYLFKPVSEIVLGAKIRAMQRLIQMRQSLLALTRQLDSTNRELKRLSTRDGLTGIANRRAFDDTLAREWKRGLRSKTEVALLLCDVDFFKVYNDTLGHQAGDECLKQVAATLRTATSRGADAVARYGGEEFAIILPGTPIDGAVFIAEKIRQTLFQQAIAHPSTPSGHVTLSIGVASLLPGADTVPADLILAADRALYAAKEQGRNRVVRCESQEVKGER